MSKKNHLWRSVHREVKNSSTSLLKSRNFLHTKVDSQFCSGTAHNPIFKDDAHDEDNPLWQAKQAARKASRRHHDERREQRERGSRSRDRGRRRRRRRRRRSRSRTRSRSEEQQKMFWDGYQWHFNDTKDEDIEEHVTSIIRSDVDAPPNEVDQNEKMQNEAMKALRALQQNKSFGF